jgi:peptide/nickel transport system substrate-binding protein
MNTRKEIFQDWRVRDALIHAFNYEFINQTINSTKQPRITSYFSNSTLGMREGEASGLVLKYLEPYKDELIPGVLDGYHLPVSNGDIRNRKNIRIARSQLKLAGWNLIDGELQNANGKKFEFNILLESGSNENEAIMNIFIDSLKKLGINAEISIVDNAQFKARTRTYDFDLTFYRRYLSLSPGNEQKLYWGSEGEIRRYKKLYGCIFFSYR